MDQKVEIKSQIDDLLRALDRVSEALALDSRSEINRDATIQRFEFSFELVWKILKSTNLFLGTECFSPRDCIRLAAQNNIIKNPDKWLEYLKYRNLASHIYDENTAIEVYNSIPEFEKDARKAIDGVIQKIE